MKISPDERALFGPAADCRDLPELILLQGSVIGEGAKKAVAAYAMIVAARSAPGGVYFADALEVLNCLGMAKAELDQAIFHSTSTVSVTAEILSQAQKFVDENTIPCTEWPTSAEVVSCVFGHAAKHACAGPWERTLLGSRGEVIGVEEFGQAS